MSETALDRLDEVEFTYRWYRGFLERLRSDGYRFGSFDEPTGRDDVLLRHDVDLSVDGAIRMARIEAELGVHASYFLLLTSPLYNLLDGETRELVREIESLGHDVGLHFSTHQYWPEDAPPDEDALTDRIDTEYRVLASVVEEPLSTLSFHRPPEWVLDRAFDGFRSTYEPAFLSEIGYRADSNQRWRDTSPLEGDLPRPVQVLTHPGLWGEDDASFGERVEQAVAGACKRARTRSRREFGIGGDG